LAWKAASPTASASSKRQPHEHAARVGAHRLVDVLADIRERDDAVHLLVDLAPSQAEQAGRQPCIVATAVLRMKSGAQFQQSADASVHLDRASRRLHDPGDDRQQRALAGAVATEQADSLASGHL
jgi:hypothetical protein